MSFPDDEGLVRAVEHFGIGADALLGHGGEAWVYGLDASRILRVHHAGVREETVAGRAALLAELAHGADAIPFSIPEVVDTVVVERRIVTIERRLPGRPLTAVLGEAAGEARASLVRAYLDTAARIGDLVLERPWYGDLLQEDPIRTGTFREYLEKRSARSLRLAGPGLDGIEAAELAAALPEPRNRALVHLDAFPGNMLAQDGVITSVLDFGVVAIVGDRRLDPLTAAAYLSPNITPTATDADCSIAEEWLAAHGLDGLYEAARRWAAAFWSFARDDVRLHEWCRSTLHDARSL